MHSSSARHVATGSVRFGEKDTRLYYVCMYMSVCLSPAFNFLEAYGCGHHGTNECKASRLPRERKIPHPPTFLPDVHRRVGYREAESK